jgi:hypothetical protein
MAWPVALDSGFLHLDASSAPSHEMILSGPSGSPPGSPHENGTAEWRGAYGTPVNEWDAATYGAGYTGPGTPNRSWLLDSSIPDGWYSVIRRMDNE